MIYLCIFFLEKSLTTSLKINDSMRGKSTKIYTQFFYVIELVSVNCFQKLFRVKVIGNFHLLQY